VPFKVPKVNLQVSYAFLQHTSIIAKNKLLVNRFLPHFELIFYQISYWISQLGLQSYLPNFGFGDARSVTPGKPLHIFEKYDQIEIGKLPHRPEESELCLRW
jgi:hypothetical protein